MLKTGEYSNEDLRLYGILHQQMMQRCLERAEEIFDRVLKKGPEEDAVVYWRVRRQKGYFLRQIGRNQENIREFQPLVEAGSRELQEWICLIQAYQFAEEYGMALQWAKKAAEVFPENAYLHIYTGDLLRAMKRYDEAFPIGGGRWKWSRSGVTRLIPWDSATRNWEITARPRKPGRTSPGILKNGDLKRKSTGPGSGHGNVLTKCKNRAPSNGRGPQFAEKTASQKWYCKLPDVCAIINVVKSAHKD